MITDPELNARVLAAGRSGDIRQITSVLRRLWMSVLFHGPSERFDHEEAFDQYLCDLADLALATTLSSDLLRRASDAAEGIMDHGAAAHTAMLADIAEEIGV